MTRRDATGYTSSDRGPTSAAVRAELNRILASPSFSASARKCKFLTYVVEQTLAGHSDHLAAYDVAVAVFDRDERFDPRSDPLVRITARRVRAALDQYYLTVGRSDPLRIVLPKGSYRPLFDTSPPPANGSGHAENGVGALQIIAPPPRAKWPARSVVVSALLLIGAAIYVYFAFSARRAVETTETVRLGRERIVVPAVRNVGHDPRLDQAAETMTKEVRLSFCCGPQFQIVPPESAADLELDGMIEEDATGVRARFLLTTAATGRVLWTESYRLPQVTGTELMDAGVTQAISDAMLRVAHPH
jgi:hypothetical protein